MEIDKPILNFGWKLKGPRLSKAILEKNKVPSLLTPCHACISGVRARGCVSWKHWKIADMMFAPRYFNKHLLSRGMAYLNIMPLLIYFFIMPLLHGRKWQEPPNVQFLFKFSKSRPKCFHSCFSQTRAHWSFTTHEVMLPLSIENISLAGFIFKIILKSLLWNMLKG